MIVVLLKNAVVHDGLGGEERLDVLIEEGKILRVAKDIPGEGL